MKVLVTGARGMLGTDMVEVLSKEHTVRGLDVGEVDITDARAVETSILEVEPQIVVHAAAYTDVDGCESNVRDAYRVNAIGTRNIALACRKVGAAMLYVSTDFVFDGFKTEPYLERDRPNPLNVYGFSKLAGEQFVSSLLAEHYIIRTAWLYGENGKNFVTTMMRLADCSLNWSPKGERRGLQPERRKAWGKLKVVDDQFGSPTYTVDVALAVARLIKTGKYGMYHAVNSGQVSWCGFARKVLELSGRHRVPVKPISSEQLSRPAIRPAYSVLQNSALASTIGGSIRTWESALEDFIGNRMVKPKPSGEGRDKSA
ncbi:MAG: SDR family oxidoreductase [Candidatus Aquicultor sp.]